MVLAAKALLLGICCSAGWVAVAGLLAFLQKTLR